MIRDHIELSNLKSICSASLKERQGSHPEPQFFSAVGIIVYTKPLHWHKRKRNNMPVECFEFFLSDETNSWFKLKLWGSSAMLFASRIRLHHIVVIDRFTCYSSDGNDVCGVFTDSQTSINSIYDEFGRCLVDLFRYAKIITRACEILQLQASLR